MFAQLLFTQGLGELRPVFSKVFAAVFVMFLALSTTDLQGQVIVEVIGVETLQSENSNSQENFGADVESKSPKVSFSYLEVTPNPFSSKLVISAHDGDEVTYVELLNDDGEAILSGNVYGNRARFVLESLSPGTYFVQVTHREGFYSQAVEYQP